MRNSILSTGNTGYSGGSSNSKKIVLIMIIALMALIIIGGAIFAYTYFFTDAFLSEQQGFYKYITKNAEIIEMFKDKDLDKYLEKTQKEAYSNNGEFSVAVTGNMGEEIKQITDEIQKHKITFNGSVDSVNKYSYQELKLKYGETDVISGALINKNDYYGLKVNDIGLNPYIIVENNNLKQLFKNLGSTDEQIKNIPDKIDFEKLQKQEIFTKDELKQLKDKYLKAITDNLPEDRFSKSEKDGIDVYTLTINEKCATNVAIAIIDTLVNDNLLLNKVKQICIEQSGMTEQEAQTMIDSFKQSLQDAKEDLVTSQSTENSNDLGMSGITYDVAPNPEPEIDENIYINVYVSNKNLIKTEIIPGDDGKITLTKEQNKATLDIAENESNLVGPTENSGDKTSTVFKTVASINIAKTKTNNELSYKVTVLGEDKKEYGKATLSYSGLSDLTNVSTNLLYDINVSDILNNSIYDIAKDTANNSKSNLEQEKVVLALTDLIADLYEDKYIHGNETEINETTIKQVLVGQGLDITVSMNEDGTYKLQSKTTGNIYTVDSTGKLINTEEAVVIQDETSNEEKTMLISLSLIGNTTFGAIQQQELAENNMYIINNKTYEQLESLFTTLGERVAYKVLSAYKNTPIGQLMAQ